MYDHERSIKIVFYLFAVFALIFFPISKSTLHIVYLSSHLGPEDWEI